MSAASAPPAAEGVRRNRRFSRGLHLYIVLEIFKSFVVVMLSFEAVIGCIFSFGAVRNYGIDMRLLLPLLGPALAAYLDAAIPVSLLFSTALAYGRLIADREIAAMKSFGFSYLELAAPAATLGAAMGVCVLALNFYVIPGLRFTRDNLGGIILERLKSIGEGENQSFDLGKNSMLWVERIQGERMFEGIFIAAQGPESLGVQGLPGNDPKAGVQAISYPFFIYAARGEVVTERTPGDDRVFIELSDVKVYYDIKYRVHGVPTNFKERLEFSRLPIPVTVPMADKNNKELAEPDLRRKLAECRSAFWAARAANPAPGELERARRNYYGVVTEYHRRITFAVVVLTFPLAAVLIALFLNSPNRLLPVFTALMVVTPLFYVLEMRGNSLGGRGWSPWLMEELGNVGLAALIGGISLALRRRTVW